VLEDFVSRLLEHDLAVEFAGHSTSADTVTRDCGVAVVRGADTPPPGTAPSSFRVCAIVPCFNERDVIVATVRRLVSQGIEVVVVDNESTDGSADLVREHFGTERVAVETWSANGTYELASLLRRIEQIAASHPADWIVMQDADEVRQPPWLGVSLRDALWTMQRRGFNAVDHTVLNFVPVPADRFAEGDPADALLHFDFGRHRGYFHQIRAWRNVGPVSLAQHGGHVAEFPGRRVAPYKFLLRHYPIRSQEHGLRKILVERRPRWPPEELAKGWHTHYGHVTAETNLLGDPARLFRWNEADFYREHLVERLTGVGLV
jgi:glycosyltransferase involved in cell wall biosynthesis